MEEREVCNVDVSVILPVYNEVEVLPELYRQLKSALEAIKRSYEVIFVDDGSTDGSGQVIKKLAKNDPTIVLITFRRNFGQTAALAAGFDYARGEIIIAMDADLQSDPNEISKFLEKIEEGYDIVSGWRKNRVESFWRRRLPSLVANKIMKFLSGVPIHDFGATFKAYRRNIIKQLKLYSDHHRFIPALASALGARITEIPIKNVERPYGKSKYGLGRIFPVLFDFISIKFFLGYLTRPLQFFGSLGLVCLLSGLGIGIYLLVDKFWFGKPIMLEHGPLALLMVILIIISMTFVSLGLLGEVLSRIYFEGTGKKIYVIREVWIGNKDFWISRITPKKIVRKQ